MKNTKFRRILLLLACAVLLVSLSVGATLAYLTSTADVTNTFTVGNVEIKLDEAEVDPETGKAKIPANRTEDGNQLVRMVPGRLIDKDPTVTVLAGSEDCYVRVKVIVDVSGCTTVNWDATISGDETNGEGQPRKTNLDILADTFVGTYIRYKNAEGDEIPYFNKVNWKVGSTPIVDRMAETVTYILNYQGGVAERVVAKATTDTKLEPVFTHVYVPTNLDKTELAKLAGMKIKVVAEAIQAEGFTSDDTTTAEVKAWEAFEDN